MNTFMKFVFYIGFLFFGGGFVVAVFQYFAYNGFGNVFEYATPEHIETCTKIDSAERTKTIFYIYWIDKREYNSKQSVYIDKIPKYDFYESNVFYNKQIPFLSYAGNKELKLRSPASGMLIFGFFFLFSVSKKTPHFSIFHFLFNVIKGLFLNISIF